MTCINLHILEYRKSLIINFEYLGEEVITFILRLIMVPCWIVISLAQLYRKKKIHEHPYREWNTMRWIKYRRVKAIAKKSKHLGIVFHWSQFPFNYRLIIKMLTVHNASINLSMVGLKALDLLLTSGTIYTYISMLTYLTNIFNHLLCFNVSKYNNII